MSLFLATEDLTSAVIRLGQSSARSRLCEFLIGMRTCALVPDEAWVGIAESSVPYIQALEQMTLVVPRGSDPNWDEQPYFNPFGTGRARKGGYRSRKYRSNGPSNAIHSWANEEHNPFILDIASRPFGQLGASGFDKGVVLVVE